MLKASTWKQVIIGIINHVYRDNKLQTFFMVTTLTMALYSLGQNLKKKFSRRKRIGLIDQIIYSSHTQAIMATPTMGPPPVESCIIDIKDMELDDSIKLPSDREKVQLFQRFQNTSKYQRSREKHDRDVKVRPTLKPVRKLAVFNSPMNKVKVKDKFSTMNGGSVRETAISKVKINDKCTTTNGMLLETCQIKDKMDHPMRKLAVFNSPMNEVKVKEKFLTLNGASVGESATNKVKVDDKCTTTNGMSPETCQVKDKMVDTSDLYQDNTLKQKHDFGGQVCLSYNGTDKAVDTSDLICDSAKLLYNEWKKLYVSGEIYIAPNKSPKPFHVQQNKKTRKCNNAVNFRNWNGQIHDCDIVRFADVVKHFPSLINFFTETTFEELKPSKTSNCISVSNIYKPGNYFILIS